MRAGSSEKDVGNAKKGGGALAAAEAAGDRVSSGKAKAKNGEGDNPPRKKAGGKRGASPTAAKRSVLTEAGAASLDEFRDNTIGLFARHLEQPLLQQPSMIHSFKVNGITVEEAESAATANFFKSLPPETRKLYENAAADENDRQAKANLAFERKRLQQDTMANRTSSLEAQCGGGPSPCKDRGAPPTDDRITAQALHMLLGKTRASVERMMPPALSSLSTRYYTFDTSGKLPQREAEMKNALAAKSNLIAYSLSEMRAEIKHQEPPVVGPSSQSVRYYYPNGERDDGATGANGTATTTATAAAAAATGPGEEAGSYRACKPVTGNSFLKYPPVPVQYASIDLKKQAMTRKRLGLNANGAPTFARTPGEGGKRGNENGRGAHRTAKGSLPKGVMAAEDVDHLLLTAEAGRGRLRGASALPDIQPTGNRSSVGFAHDDGYDDDDDDGNTERRDRRLLQQEKEWAERNESLDFDIIDAPISRRSNNANLKFALNAAANRGSDASLVLQLVKLYVDHMCGRKAVPQQPPPPRAPSAFHGRGGAPPGAKAATANAPANSEKAARAESPALTSPMMEALLSVSREYDQVRVTAAREASVTCSQKSKGTASSSLALSGISSGGGGGDGGAPSWLAASDVTRDRQRVVSRLTSFASTRIPEQYWVTVQQKTAPSSRSNGATTAAAAAAADADAGTDAPDALSMLVAADTAASREGTLTSDQLHQQRGAARRTTPQSNGNGNGSVNGSGGASRASNVPQVERCASARESDLDNGITKEGLVVFPAPRPIGRAQVYLLAETLDHMLNADPSWQRIMSDHEIAYTILPPAANGKRKSSPAGADMDDEHANPLMDPEIQWRSGQAYETYTRASGHILQVLDIGFVELVRQTAAQCVERGALLDALRQAVVDIAESHIRVLAYTKSRAFEEATARVAIREELTDMRQELAAAMETIQALRDRQRDIEAEKDALQEKAGRFDELVSRVEAKRRRHEIHSEEAHVCVLRELEKQMKQSASEAISTVFEERCRLAGLKGDAEGEEGDSLEGSRSTTSTSSTASMTAALKAGITEAPSTEEARKRVSEQKKAAGALYHQAHQLLRTLHEATEAMNAASAPLYDNVVLKTVSPAANVATSHWVAIARTVGAFEKEKSHRQRVFAVFCDWCDKYQRLKAKVPLANLRRGDGSAKEGSVLEYSSKALRARARGLTGEYDESHDAGGGGFLLGSSSSGDGDSDGDGDGDGKIGPGSRANSLCGESAASFMSMPSSAMSKSDVNNKSFLEAGGEMAGLEHRKRSKLAEKKPESAHVLSAIQYVTPGDLLEMGIHDCTADEINSLFANGFDFKEYLHPSRKAFQQPVQDTASDIGGEALPLAQDGSTTVATAVSGGGGSGGGSGEWMLTLSDVAEMVRDIQATLSEMTLRMRAMAKSAILKKGVQPPMQPPERPEDPCPLCGRCDTLTDEKKRRQQALRQVAKDVQRRLEGLVEKCQRAEAEREDARGDARRLLAEVQALKEQGREPTNRVAEPRLRPSSGGVGGEAAPAPRSIIKSRSSSALQESDGSQPDKGAGAARLSGSGLRSGGSGNSGSRKRVTVSDPNEEEQQQSQQQSQQQQQAEEPPAKASLTSEDGRSPEELGAEKLARRGGAHVRICEDDDVEEEEEEEDDEELFELHSAGSEDSCQEVEEEEAEDSMDQDIARRSTLPFPAKDREGT